MNLQGVEEILKAAAKSVSSAEIDLDLEVEAEDTEDLCAHPHDDYTNKP